MTWRARVGEEDLKIWDTLEQTEAPPGVEAPPDIPPDALVRAVFQVAHAKGLLQLAEDGSGFQLSPLGELIEDCLVPLAAGRTSGWQAAVLAVGQAKGHEDPDTYFAQLNSRVPGGPPTSNRPPVPGFDRGAAAQIWTLISEMQAGVSAATHERHDVRSEEGTLTGLAWVPAGQASALDSLKLTGRVSEWRRPDGARLAYIPIGGLALSLYYAAEEAELLSFDGSDVVPAENEGGVVAVLQSHQPGSPSPDDAGIIALMERLA